MTSKEHQRRIIEAHMQACIRHETFGGLSFLQRARRSAGTERLPILSPNRIAFVEPQPPSPPLTLEMLQKAQREIKQNRSWAAPLPVTVKISENAPVFVEAKPKAEPRTDDMRQMCEDLGPQKIPGALTFEYFGTKTVIVHPVNAKGIRNENAN